jgi:transcription elongation factor GreA-like protein
MHAKLRKEINHENDYIDLTALDKCLPTNLRDKFKQLTQVEDVYRKISDLNKAFVPVLDHLVCFKSELGLCL